MPRISDSQICNCTGTILWHKALVLELNREPKMHLRAFGVLKNFPWVIPPDPYIKGIRVGKGFKRNNKGTKRK